MLQMTGMVVNLFTKEGGKDKEGKEYEPTHKVQILGAVDLPNGDVQNELVDLKVDSLDDWMTYKGKNVAVDVGIYAPQKKHGCIFHQERYKATFARLDKCLAIATPSIGVWGVRSNGTA